MIILGDVQHMYTILLIEDDESIGRGMSYAIMVVAAVAFGSVLPVSSVNPGDLRPARPHLGVVE